MVVLTEVFVQALKVGLVFVPAADNCFLARLRSADSQEGVALVALAAGAEPVPAVALCRSEEELFQVVDQAFLPDAAGSHCQADFPEPVFRAPRPRPVVVSMSHPSRVQRDLRRDLCWSKLFFPARQL